jgi:hypothetical protein
VSSCAWASTRLPAVPVAAGKSHRYPHSELQQFRAVVLKNHRCSKAGQITKKLTH